MRWHSIAEAIAAVVALIQDRRHIVGYPGHDISSVRAQVRALDLHAYGDQNTQDSTPENSPHHPKADFAALGRCSTGRIVDASSILQRSWTIV